jgi:hypothetical protein
MVARYRRGLGGQKIWPALAALTATAIRSNVLALAVEDREH